MTHRCQCRHRVCLADIPGPELCPIPDGAGNIIAWQCPTCLRTWPADLAAFMVGVEGNELPRASVPELRAAMLRACEEAPR